MDGCDPSSARVLSSAIWTTSDGCCHIRLAVFRSFVCLFVCFLSSQLSANQLQPRVICVKVFLERSGSKKIRTQRLMLLPRVFIFRNVKLFVALVSSSAWWRVLCLCCTVTDDHVTLLPLLLCTCEKERMWFIYSPSVLVHLHFFISSFYLFP